LPNSDKLCHHVSEDEPLCEIELTPIEWRLLTNRSAASLSGAAEWIDWYRAHWEIEMPFKVFKNSCTVEELQLGMIDYIERAWLCARS